MLWGHSHGLETWELARESVFHRLKRDQGDRVKEGVGENEACGGASTLDAGTSAGREDTSLQDLLHTGGYTHEACHGAGAQASLHRDAAQYWERSPSGHARHRPVEQASISPLCYPWVERDLPVYLRMAFAHITPIGVAKGSVRASLGSTSSPRSRTLQRSMHYVLNC